MTVAIVSSAALSEPDGSSYRPLTQCKGLVANGFNDFELFGSNSLADSEQDRFSIIHAHQNSGLLYRNYVVDLHGAFTRQFRDALGKYSLLKRKAAELLYLRGIEKMEKTLLGKARGIICAGESIEEFARPTGKAFLVRNCLDMSRYEDCDWSSTKVAVCGPFLKTYQNRYQLEYVTAMAKAFPKLTFLLIGRMDDQDLRELSGFRNICTTGFVEDFVKTLRSCSVLFAPYPHFTSQGGAKTKVLEAAACRMPIVATPYAICDFFAENVMVGKDSESLGRHLQYLSESEDNRKSIGKSMKEYVSEKHNHLTETKKLIKIYREFSGR